MKHTRKKLSDTKIQFSVSLEPSELAEAKKLALVRLAKNVKAAGFRPGKVPPKIAEKHIAGEELHNAIVDGAVNKAIVDTFTENDIQPLERPAVEVKKYVPDELLEFTAEAEVLPEIKLGNYKQLKVTPKKVTVDKKDIDEVIERMQQGFAEKKAVERAAKLGDEVSIDFEGTDKKGDKVAGASGKDYPLTLGSKSFIPGFEEGLVGKKTGDTFELPLAFPKDYHASHLAGTKIIFSVKVNKVQQIDKPKVDDEFAKKCGPFKTVAELRKDIKAELMARKKEEADRELKDKLVEQLVKTSVIPVPEVLIGDQEANLQRDMQQNLMSRGMTLQQYLTEQKLTEEEWNKKELKPAAIARVQAGLALAELTKLEKIEASKQELDARHAEMKQQYGSDPTVLAQLDSPEVRRDLANRVLTEKTIDRLVELNTKNK